MITDNIHQFNLEGKLIRTFATVDYASLELDKPKNQIFTAIRRGSVIKQSYYLSFNIDFKPKVRKTNFNPLFSKGNRRL